MSDLAEEFFKQPPLSRQSDPPPWMRQVKSGASVAGNDGPPGDEGDAGEQGEQGARGFVGVQGYQGYQGNPGAQGAQGDQGPQGAVGDQGDQGDTGDQGDQGNDGADGAQGAVGAEGPPGNDAVKGAMVRVSGGPPERPYARLFCAEAPEVWFFDFVRIPGGEQRTARVDPLFIEACEPGSLFVQTVAPAALAWLSDDQRAVHATDTTEALVVTLYGVRKGFAGVRLTRHTERQHEENNRFWNEQFTADE